MREIIFKLMVIIAMILTFIAMAVSCIKDIYVEETFIGTIFVEALLFFICLIMFSGEPDTLYLAERKRPPISKPRRLPIHKTQLQKDAARLNKELRHK